MKKSVKAIVIVLTLVLMMGLLPGVSILGETTAMAAVADTSWFDANPNASVFYISTAEQLLGLSQLVNNGNTFSGKTIYLTDRIQMNSSNITNWQPIGTNARRFEGVFDAQGYRIDNLSIDQEAGWAQDSNPERYGLFGVVGQSATIRNVRLSDARILIRTSPSQPNNFVVGGIAGENLGTIENSSVTGSQGIISATGAGAHYVGGIAGVNGTSGLISSCYNASYVVGSNPEWGWQARGFRGVGGISGDNRGVSTRGIRNCFNVGQISSTNMPVGGIAGRGTGPIVASYIDTNYYLSRVELTYNHPNHEPHFYIGGIVGRTNESNNTTGGVASSSFWINRGDSLIRVRPSGSSNWVNINRAIGGIDDIVGVIDRPGSRTPAEVENPDRTIPGFDFNTVWARRANVHAPPILRAFHTPPVITTQPTSVTVREGETATFTVAATGMRGSSHDWIQWQSDIGGVWSNIPGNTNSETLGISGTIAHNGTRYRAIISNDASVVTPGAGTVISDIVTMTVTNEPGPPIITTHPQSQTFTAYDNVTLRVAVAGYPAPTIEWEAFDPDSGTWQSMRETSDTLVLDSWGEEADGAQFRAVARNIHGTATSDTAVISVLRRPMSIIRIEHPSPSKPHGELQSDLVTVTAMGSAPRTFSISGEPPGVTLEGYYDNYDGTSTAYINIAGTTAIGNHTFTITASNGTMPAASQTHSFSITPVLEFTSRDSLSVISGTTEVLNVTTSIHPASFRLSGAPSSVTINETSGLLRINNWTPVGTYNFLIIASYDVPRQTWREQRFTLTVSPAPTAPEFTEHPQNQTVTAGQSATFTASATGIPNPALQWQVNTGTGWNILGNETSTTLTVQNTTISQNGHKYRAVARNDHSAVSSNHATLTVNTIRHSVTVNNGTGGGQFAQGDTVDIVADQAPAGQRFSSWTSTPNVTFANANNSSTSFTMPGEAVTVTANFAPLLIHGDLTGSGSVTPQDSSLLARFLGSWDNITIIEDAADVDLDGRITPRDLAVLRRHLAEWIGYETLPVPIAPPQVAPMAMSSMSGQPTISIDDAIGNVGDIVEVAINLLNNPGIVTMRLGIEFDTNVLRLESADDKNLIPNAFHSDRFTSPYTLLWDNGASRNNFTNSGELVVLRFEILAETTGTPITVRYDNAYWDIFDTDYNLIYFNIINGTISTPPPQCTHNYQGATTTPATCIAEGTRTYTCTICNHSYTEPVPINPHNHITGRTERVHTPATPTTEGVMGIYCEGCDELVDTRAIPPPQCTHNYQGITTTPATCIAEGTRTYTCTICSHSYTEPVPINPHNHITGRTEQIINEATYTAEGLMGIYCAGCDDLVDTRVIPKREPDTTDFTFTVGNTTAPRNGTATVPIRVSNNPGFAAVGLTVRYDPNLLQLTGATGPVVEMGIPYFALSDNPGEQILLLINPQGDDWNGNGTVANLTFNVISPTEDTTDITIEFNQAHNGWPTTTDGIRLYDTTTQPGRVTIGPEIDIYYEVTFEPAGGQRISGGLLEQDVKRGEWPILPELSRHGYIHTGWNPAVGAIWSDMTFTALWEEDAGIARHAVTFNLNGGTHTGGGPLSQLVIHGGAAIEPLVGRASYRFVDWDTPFNNVTGPITVTAIWEREPEQHIYHTVIFDLNGGTRIGGGNTSQEVREGNAATAPILAHRPGYTYSWNVSFDNIQGPITVTAIWTPIRYGDLNRDGAVDLADLIIMLRFFAQTITKDEFDFAAAKVAGGEGEINHADLIMFIKFFAEPGIILGPRN